MKKDGKQIMREYNNRTTCTYTYINDDQRLCCAYQQKIINREANKKELLDIPVRYDMCINCEYKKSYYRKNRK